MTRPFVALAIAVSFAACASTRPAEPNTLSQKEIEAGWELLFDGESLGQWRTYKEEDPRAGWQAQGGTIARVGAGGDLITREQFANFELEFEWKISPRGNSGVMFRVTEDQGATFETGPEFQLVDNALLRGRTDRLHAAGSNYALHPPKADNTNPVGEWNTARILVRDAHVEHWMNGVMQCQYQLWGTEWTALVEASKFDSMPGYGLNRRGHIALQDHGNDVWFRSIKIKRVQ